MGLKTRAIIVCSCQAKVKHILCLEPVFAPFASIFFRFCNLQVTGFIQSIEQFLIFLGDRLAF